MGIFDGVIGKKDTGGGLFSKKSAFAEKENPLAAPLPATAHLAALRATIAERGGRLRARRPRQRPVRLRQRLGQRREAPRKAQEGQGRVQVPREGR